MLVAGAFDNVQQQAINASLLSVFFALMQGRLGLRVDNMENMHGITVIRLFL